MRRSDDPLMDQALAADRAEAPDDVDDAERQAEIDALLERVARELAERRLATPAMFLLEATLPLSFVASQALIVIEPIVQSILDLKDYERFQQLMEDREKVRTLIDRLEELEEQRGERLWENRRRKRQKAGEPPATGEDDESA
jgi:hypothetical protein